MSAFSDRIRDQKNKGLYKVADFEGGKEVTHIISHLLEAVEMFGKEVDILNFSDTARQLQTQPDQRRIPARRVRRRSGNVGRQGGDAVFSSSTTSKARRSPASA